MSDFDSRIIMISITSDRLDTSLNYIRNLGLCLYRFSSRKKIDDFKIDCENTKENFFKYLNKYFITYGNQEIEFGVTANINALDDYGIELFLEKRNAGLSVTLEHYLQKEFLKYGYRIESEYNGDSPILKKLSISERLLEGI